MTTKSVLDDQRYTFSLLQGGTATVGRRYSKTQSGGNYTPSEPNGWPHPYTMSLSDENIGIQRRLVKPGYESYYPGGGADESMMVQGQLVRPWNSNDDLALYGKLADKFDDMSFNTPVFAGELGEATDMLAGRLRQLAQVGRAVRKGNFAKAAKLLGVAPKPTRTPSNGKSSWLGADKPFLQNEQTITSAWLELRYGWKPLLSDISNLADAIAKRDLPRKSRITAYHWIGKKGTCNLSCADPSIVGSGKYSKSIVAYLEEVLPSVPERMGLQDPASILWELTPFSFVADWVYPLGDYLRARSLINRVKGVFVITTYDRHHFHIANTPCIATWGLQLPTVHIPPWSIKAVVERSVYEQLPSVKPPVLRTPGFWGTGPSDRLRDAISLVREIFGSKTSRRV